MLTYDIIGNLTSLNRDNTGANAYNYTGNRLNSINNLTGAYQYDANGNATTDGRNGMTLTYNYLNLPSTANKSGTSLAYTYNAAGQKLVKNYNGSIRNYINGIEYNGNTIDIIHTEEGLAQNNGGTYTYKYNLSDHLGNVRYTFDIYNGAVRRLQSDDFSPFNFCLIGVQELGKASVTMLLGKEGPYLRLVRIINICTTVRKYRMNWVSNMITAQGSMIRWWVGGMWLTRWRS